MSDEVKSALPAPAHRGLWVGFSLLAALLVGLLAMVWNMWSRGVELEDRLRTAEIERQSLDQKLGALRSQSDGMRAAADSAEMRAAHAEVKSNASTKPASAPSWSASWCGKPPSVTAANRNRPDVTPNALASKPRESAGNARPSSTACSKP